MKDLFIDAVVKIWDKFGFIAIISTLGCGTYVGLTTGDEMNSLIAALGSGILASILWVAIMIVIFAIMIAVYCVKHIVENGNIH
jgi:hypothetical protein